MTIKIVTDSTCDIPAQIVKEKGISVVPLYINIGDQGYRDNVDISRKEFYEQLPHYDPHPQTAAPGVDMFRAVYDQLAAEGASAILSIHISISLSATIDVARVAAEQTTSVPVVAFDSQQLSMGTGFLVLRAAEAAVAGQPLDEIIQGLQAQIPRTHVFAALDTLEYLKRSGRMHRVVASLGNLLEIRPLLKMYQGDPTAERIRTRKRALQRLVELLRERAPFEKLAMLHIRAREEAEALMAEVKDLLPTPDILFTEVNPVIGANIGPGVVGFACVEAANG